MADFVAGVWRGLFMGGVSGVVEYECRQFVKAGGFERRLTSEFPGGFAPWVIDRFCVRLLFGGQKGGYMGNGMSEVNCGDPPVPWCVPLSRVEARHRVASLFRGTALSYSRLYAVGCGVGGAYLGDVPPSDATRCMVSRHLGTLRGNEGVLSCD